MSIEVKLPELGDGIESGDILEVLVSPGDIVQKDQGIAEIETDKATAEVPSPYPGRVAQVHVSAGDTVQIGQLLLTLEEVAQQATPTAPPEPRDVQQEPVETAPAQPKMPAPSERKQTEEAAQPTPSAAAPVPPTPPAISAPPPAEPSQPSGRVIPAGPAIRRFAREVGVDLSNLQGTGPRGRITRDDVLRVVREANRAVQSPGGAAGQLPASGDRDDWGPVRKERASRMRRTIAAKMHESWSSVPRVTNFDDADVTELERIRQSSKRDYEAKGYKLTSMPFVIKAVAMALREHPLINASLDPDQEQIIYKQYVNVGIAIDTDRGLVVPSLRGADELSISEIVRELAKLIDLVRSEEFTVEDLRGSTFTISNLGAIGGTYSTPIVNTPEVAILLVGRSRKMPVVRDDNVAIRLMMPLSLSYDHRLVDGATAARFLNDVIDYLAAPSRLLLAP